MSRNRLVDNQIFVKEIIKNKLCQRRCYSEHTVARAIVGEVFVCSKKASYEKGFNSSQLEVQGHFCFRRRLSTARRSEPWEEQFGTRLVTPSKIFLHREVK
ncbi:hypothetical protein KP509_06G015900 [Ceratopteris richardii]|uniref:Uncharacterized protein n=1 Tax=Ceratopteris richardii TaxID=49495 RepID=A0A8T2ULL3_CERRI|nr:hypothetical protein KP509_06G015900 [Ceratopteris richardii]